LQEQLAAIWQEVLKRKEIGVRDNFFELGGHSLLVVNLIQRLKSQMGISIPLSKIIEHPTIEQLARTLDVATPQASATDSLLVELKPGGAKNLFFVHDGEGETLLYRSLAQMLPAHYTVYGVMPRSLPRIPLADLTIEDMARTYLKHVRARQPHGPYLLAGLCAGGVIAFEMSAQLEAVGERAERVFIMDAVEPLARPRSFGTSKRRLNRLLGGLAAPDGGAAPLRVARGLGTALRKAWNMTRYETSRTFKQAYSRYRLRLLWRVVNQARPWPSHVASLGVREIYMSARARYAPEPLNAGSFVIMKAAVGADADEPAFYQFDDPSLGWGRVVKSELLVVDVNGGHSSMLQSPHVGCLAQQFIDLIEAPPQPAEPALSATR
jgi:thioesterase domain-containing protein/acyl carrier protein